MGTLTVDNLNLKGSGSVSSLGRILQVVQTAKTDTFTSSSSSFTDITGLSVSITPSSASSKVMVIVETNTSTASGNNAILRLLRGSTAIAVGDSAGSRPQAFAQTRVNDTNASLGSSVNFLDSPNTTSATTYKVQMLSQSGTVGINRTNADSDSGVIARTISTITVMEVRG